ncbi:thiamine pyrophosphate-dependent enzyme [Mycoplasmopsis cynos]|nr:thiamine pyrophosphate-dependent enzyme [Mycoplasmopsis cynos]UWV83390.1 thiamine pyrophosphate-dependent enzyme [Mycoplasmopsis cynos]
MASYAVVKEAVEFAREGNGPVIVEFITWRQGLILLAIIQEFIELLN